MGRCSARPGEVSRETKGGKTMAKLMFLKRGSKLAGLAFGLMASMVPGKSTAKTEQIATSGASEKKIETILLEHKLSELITASGQGSIAVPPDALRIELGVEVQAKTAGQARNELARKMEALSKAIEALGEKGLVLQTALLQLEPVYTEPQPGKPARIVAYRAQNTLSLTLRDVAPAELGERAAKIADAGVLGGANVVRGISFFLTRPDEAQAKALRLAAIDAERNAKTMASTAGISLGKLHSLEGSPEHVFEISRAESFAKLSATTIEPGEIQISASVTARFHFAKE
jgi:uncharacterized protein